MKRKLAGWASSKPQIRCLVIFGSYSKGTANANSDIDIAVAVAEPNTATESDRILAWMDAKPKWLSELRELLGFEYVQLEKLCADHVHVMQYVKASHIAIYDPHNCLEQIFSIAS